MRHPSRPTLALLAMLLLLLAAQPARAQEPNRAGVVVQYGDGSVQSACVRFSEPQISGLELLSRSGFPLTYEIQGGGALVCSISGVGCAFPSQPCLCQCAGIGTCTYWSYHRRQPDGSWGYQVGGASASIVTDGTVEGWRWGTGGSGSTPPPPASSIDEICGAAPPPSATPMPPTATLPLPTPTPIPPTATPVSAPTTTTAASPSATQPTVTPTGTPSPSRTAAPSPTPRRTTTARPSMTATVNTATSSPIVVPTGTVAAPVPALRDVGSATTSYALFGLLVVALGAAALWARRGRE